MNMTIPYVWAINIIHTTGTLRSWLLLCQWLCSFKITFDCFVTMVVILNLKQSQWLLLLAMKCHVQACTWEKHAYSPYLKDVMEEMTVVRWDSMKPTAPTCARTLFVPVPSVLSTGATCAMESCTVLIEWMKQDATHHQLVPLVSQH